MSAAKKAGPVFELPGLTPAQVKEIAFRDLDTALSMVRTSHRALQPLADADVGGENPGAELVAIDVVATLEAAAGMIGESLFIIQRNDKPVQS